MPPAAAAGRSRNAGRVSTIAGALHQSCALCQSPREIFSQRCRIVTAQTDGAFRWRMAKNLRHPDRSEAEWRDLLCCLSDKRRSLDYAALWAASLGMTE